MRVFTPDDVASTTESKYLGVLVSAKYARELNALPRERLVEGFLALSAPAPEEFVGAFEGFTPDYLAAEIALGMVGKKLH